MKTNFKINSGVPIGMLWWVAVILTNLHTCQYGNCISSRYNLSDLLPSMERYLHEFPVQSSSRALSVHRLSALSA